MTRWEYKIVFAKDAVPLNPLGMDGWELAAAIVRYEGSPPELIFKRPLPEHLPAELDPLNG